MARCRRVLCALLLVVASLAGTGAARAQRPPPRGTYVHLLAGADVGASLRFNNPFRLATPLGSTPESVSTAPGYLDLWGAVAMGDALGGQHGLLLHWSKALSGTPQDVVVPAYLYLRRLQGGLSLFGHAGPSVLLSPNTNVGLELGGGASYHLTGAFGLRASLLGAGYYGAATREVAATFVPLLSGQIGFFFDYEELP